MIEYTFTPPSPNPYLSPELSTRDVEDFISCDILKKAYHLEESVSCVEKKYIFSADFSLADWAKSESRNFIFISSTAVIAIMDWGYVSAKIMGRSFNLNAYGDKKKIDIWFSKQKKYGFESEGTVINWVCGSSWREANIQQIPLESIKEIPSAYPWLGKTIKEYTEGYFNSSASVLLLIGPPGTGKTSFLKALIRESGGTPILTYEDRLLNEDGLFAHFIGDSDIDMLIFEDADTYLGSRKNSHNTMMDRFLNVSNGLVSPMKGKKLIFTTNLPGVSDIDPALLRPGRCYDVIHFRALTKKEAEVVSEEVYGEDAPELTESSYTLAEITNLERTKAIKPKKQVGFL